MLRQVSIFESNCKLDMEKGDIRHMERLRAECQCDKCRLPFMNFEYIMTEEDIKEIRQEEREEIRETVAVQQLTGLLENYSSEQVENIMNEVRINLEITEEVAGNIPGSPKPFTDRLSIL